MSLALLNTEIPSNDKAQEDSSSDPEMQNPHRDTDDSAIIRENPNVQWDDVVGLDGPKATLKEAVILCLKFPPLYGPPGTGKSFLAKAVATEAKSMFYSISSSALVSKWQGESERLVKQLFQLARESKPSIIFIDEIDALTGTRNESESEGSRRIKTEFLVQMNGVGHDDTGVLVLGATNIPWQLIMLLRDGADARRRMFELHVGDTPCQLTPEDYRLLADNTDGYSGSDIAIVVRDALMQPVRKLLSATHFKRIPVPAEDGSADVLKWTSCSPGDPEAVEKSWETVEVDGLLEPPLKVADFMKSLETNRSTCSAEDVKRHDDWTKESGNDVA
ncbi:AAA-domain-containing protein [Gymnopus androsaceus JB14]|uniref:AAA-domain-containing protein n=1 Tax=Gymnopus androsaceus JB14 TaxID=1447944 RepID=A0A6A4GNR2_9AGAR|nr:AAA-domain-containing protein [Gymnopus androsaceus JB14]